MSEREREKRGEKRARKERREKREKRREKKEADTYTYTDTTTCLFIKVKTVSPGCDMSEAAVPEINPQPRVIAVPAKIRFA